MIIRPRRSAASRVRMVVAVLVGVGLAAMCTVVATATPMSQMNDSTAMTAAMSPAHESATPADRTEPPVLPSVLPLESLGHLACDACGSVDCSVTTTVGAIGLLGLLLLFIRRRSVGVVLRRRSDAARHRASWPPCPRFAPARFELCILRV